MSVQQVTWLFFRKPDELYEYIDGSIYAMSGGSFNHDTIKSNVQRILWGLLRGGKCRVYSSDLRVFISKERYFHPDVTVTCDPRDRGTRDLLQSPSLVVEVLSPSTELKDRTWKLQNYTAHPTLEEYLLVSARSMQMELYRKEQNKWVYSAFGANDEIDLVCLGIHFLVAEAYEGIDPEEDFSSGEENDTFPGQ